MKLADILTESITAEQRADYAEWQKACKKADPNVTFTGSIGIGAQAVNWVDPGNKVVGDWDGKTFSGTVRKLINKNT